MARSLSSTVTEVYDGMRLDSYLFEAGLYESRSKAVKQIEAGKVFVGGNKPTKKTLVHTGDFIVYEEYESDEHIYLEPEDIPLDVYYDDDDLAVINKQAGLICHPSPGHPDGTLCNALIARYGRDHLAHIQGDDRPGIVHRLDGDTSGLMLVAKNDEVGFELQDEIRARSVNRRYLCLVHGNIASDTGLIDAPIFRSDKNRLRMQVSDKPQARSSVTTFKVLERFESGPKDNGFSLIECKLYSGRTHQIRVHMEYIKHWCVGDPQYGTPGKADNLGLTRQFLHSYFIEFDHPKTHETLSFLAPLPDDLRDVLHKLYDRRIGLTEDGKEVLKLYCEQGKGMPERLNDTVLDTFSLV
ncbi:MAG: RluA family pseudouridine synthase [Eggerthellaceae bacterium]